MCPGSRSGHAITANDNWSPRTQYMQWYTHVVQLKAGHAYVTGGTNHTVYVHTKEEL